MAPKKRSNGLPPYVYKRKSGYQLRVYRGKGQKMGGVMLCPADAPMSEVWKCYENQMKKEVLNVSWLLDKYFESNEFKSKESSTQKYQQERSGVMTSIPMRSGKPFGTAELKNITKGAIRQYLDKRKQDSNVVGNREVALLSVAWNWAAERDLINLPNPTVGVRRLKESPRTRYVTDKEYQTALDLAPPYLQAMMELAYLCRLRRSEVINSTRAQILPEGFDALRGKGSRDTIVEWSDRLRKAVNFDGGTVSSIYIIHDEQGQKIGVEKFKSAWTRLKRKMKKAGIETFNFHDIKAKSISDYDGDKLAASGHRDPKMLKVYDRKKPTTKSTR